MPAPEPSPELKPDDQTSIEVPFQLIRYEYGRELDEYGDPEVIDVTYNATATVMAPEPGRVVHGFFTTCGIKHDGQSYTIFTVEGQYRAFSTDYLFCPGATKLYQMHTVALDDSPQPTLAWEVWCHTPERIWEPLPDQHLRPRTAPADIWLNHVEREITPALEQQEQILLAERRQLQAGLKVIDPAGQLEPLHPDAASVIAREEFLGKEYQQARLALQQTEVRVAQITKAARILHQSAQRIGPLLYWPWDWVNHYRQRKQLRHELTVAEAAREQANQNVHQLERAAETPAAKTAIEQRVSQLVQETHIIRARIGTLDSQAKRLAGRILEAQELAHYLRQRPGIQVTLQQTAITERRTLAVPKIVDAVSIQAKMVPRRGVRL